MLCVWASPRSANTTHDEVYVTPLPLSQPSTNPNGRETSSATDITGRYNAISNAIRKGDVKAAPAYQVVIDSCRPARGSRNRERLWPAATLEVSINASKVSGHLAIECQRDSASPSPGDDSQIVFCHFPALGTWVGYRVDSLLSYCENARQAAEDGQGVQSKIVKAPMPCKVLSMSKKNGDKVTAGEIVMVVESMKMEMNISVVAGGVFNSSVQKGDAVDEGKVLCSVT